mgnify:CR=1 FL=1
MRQEVERFEDGKQTVRTYDADDRLCCIESIAASGELLTAIDYLYDAAGVNTERVVRDSAGVVLRRLHLDADGNELQADQQGPVRWASMDGAKSGVDPKGKERLED